MPADPDAFRDKFEASKDRTLFALLDAASQTAVRDICSRYPFTFQEIRQLVSLARDLTMWEEAPLAGWWTDVERSEDAELPPRQRKDRLFNALRDRIDHLRREPTDYPSCGLSTPERETVQLETEMSDKAVFGECPVSSPKTLCCQLKTIDAVENCAYGCSYCTIQTFYGRDAVVDGRLGEKLRALHLDPDRFYHVGSGQSSDSLAWGNRDGILDDLCAFAAAHPNLLLELKTKSANTTYITTHSIPPNVVCSWSLNTETIIVNEEHLTASLDERLSAARRVADRGVKVGFHFHPLVYYRGWETEYTDLARRVQATFTPEEVCFVSFGSVTLIKPVIQAIRKRGESTRILQMEMVPDPHGKLSYPDPVKVGMFRAMREAFAPWRDDVYQYLCMERHDIWQQAFDRSYATNDAFEADFGAWTMAKIRRAGPADQKA